MLPFIMRQDTKSEQWRASWFWGKEPETIRWIERMKAGSELWDVGANVGVYTLYAASRGVQVKAFEPDEKNYKRLLENVKLNGFGNVHVCDLALGEGGVLSLPVSREEGDALGDLHNRYLARAIPGRRIEGEPQYIKIDTDGGELSVLRGLGDKLLGVREESTAKSRHGKSEILERRFCEGRRHHARYNVTL